MTKYIVKLSEQEEMSLRQLALQPGYEVIFKLLQGESLDLQSAAMECTDPDKEKRLMLLTDAQVAQRIISNLVRKLAAYREVIMPELEQQDDDPLGFNLMDRRSN